MRRLPHKQAQQSTWNTVFLSFCNLIHYGWGHEKYLLKVILRFFVTISICLLYIYIILSKVLYLLYTLIHRIRSSFIFWARTRTQLLHPSSNGHLWNYAARSRFSVNFQLSHHQTTHILCCLTDHSTVNITLNHRKVSPFTRSLLPNHTSVFLPTSPYRLYLFVWYSPLKEANKLF